MRKAVIVKVCAQNTCTAVAGQSFVMCVRVVGGVVHVRVCWILGMGVDGGVGGWGVGSEVIESIDIANEDFHESEGSCTNAV
jgi:hypothetical protein